MSFFKGIGFENFRVFDNKVYFDFAPITILTGTNNSGKSSLINGIKLLKENFINLKASSQSKTELNLQAVLESVIDTKSLVERYGSLDQFITKGSENNEFIFSIRSQLIKGDDEIEINFYVRIDESIIKVGRIAKITMQSLSDNETIFEIDTIKSIENSSKLLQEHYKIKVNFLYFYKEFEKKFYKSKQILLEKNNILKVNSGQISLNESEELLSKFNYINSSTYTLFTNKFGEYEIGEDDGYGEILPVNFPISEHDFQLIYSDVKAFKSPYDFSYLWKDNEINKVVFEKDLCVFYNKTISEAYLNLNRDVLSFLSEIEWITPFESISTLGGVNFIFQKSHLTDLVGFKKFIDLFIISEPSLDVDTINEDSSFKIDEYLILSAIEKNKNFYTLILKPLLSIVIKYFLKHDEIGSNIFDKMVISNSERFFTQFIYQNINNIGNSIQGVFKVDFISTNKMYNQRSYSLAGKDEFTILVKKLDGMNISSRTKAYEFVNKWLKEFDIADELIIEHDYESGFFKAYLKTSDQKAIMADFGFGTTQIIPLLLKILPENNPNWDQLPDHRYFFEFIPRILVIEEPETNLHPALQSKLADLFVEANQKFGIQLIIETHSEYLIRKLQYLTGKGKVDSKDIQIYYFYNPGKIPNGEEQVKKININKDGSLTDDFGAGFFDEANSWKFELLKINNPQKN